METFIGESGTHWTYDPGDELGHGGFGVVAAGTGPDGERIAVKRFDLSNARAEPLERLLREVTIGSRIQPEMGTHLLPAVDYMHDEKTLLLVMPRAERSLADAIQAGMTDDERLQAVRDVATGLAELHGIPILHRDLKPGNVLYHEGIWKLADFGLARDLDAATATLTWRGGGTLPYMAPELFNPPFSATPKSDLYALGCMSYEVWSGHSPFQAEDSLELVRLHREAPVPPLPESVNVTIRRITTRLLEKEPSGRPQDARAVVEGLGRVVLGPVSPEARRLQELAAQHVDERAAEDAVTNAALAAAQAYQHQVAQALADLRAIVEAGTDLVNEGLPDVEFSRRGDEMVMGGHDARLYFRIWMPNMSGQYQVRMNRLVGQQAHYESHLLYGQVDGGNRRMDDEPPLGNVVCEVSAGRLEWIVYRYERANIGQPYDYPYGPENRHHGMLKDDLFDAKVYPYAFRGRTVGQLFQKTWQVLTPEGVRQLFAAALALPEDSPLNP